MELVKGFGCRPMTVVPRQTRSSDIEDCISSQYIDLEALNVDVDVFWLAELVRQLTQRGNLKTVTRRPPKRRRVKIRRELRGRSAGAPVAGSLKFRRRKEPSREFRIELYLIISDQPL